MLIDLKALSMQPRVTATHNLVYSMQPALVPLSGTHPLLGA